MAFLVAGAAGVAQEASAILASMVSKTLSPAAWAFRLAHGAIAMAFLGAIAYIRWCALTGRRGGGLRLAVVAIVGEGVFVAANHGDCPLGPLQARLGDPVPLFELLLSPSAARRAVPTLGVVATAGLVLLASRSAEHDLTARSERPAASR